MKTASNVIRLPIPPRPEQTVEVPVWLLSSLSDRVRDLHELLDAVAKNTGLDLSPNRKEGRS